MVVFALDSCAKIASVAILKDEKLIYESYLDTGLTHSETLLKLCDDAFKSTDLTPKDVDLFAVSAGPGSFTGLRIGMGIIKGFAFATGAKCACVSSLLAMAKACPFDGVIFSSIDARRGRVYGSLFEKNGDELTRICDDSTEKAEYFYCMVKNSQKNIICVGDGAQLCYNNEEKLSNTIILNKYYVLGRASGVARAGIVIDNKGESCTGEELEPIYLALCQAERERNERLAKSEK